MVNIMQYGIDIIIVIKKGDNNMFIKGDKIAVVNNKADTTRLKNGMAGTLLEITPHFVIVKLEGIATNLMFAPAEFFDTFDKVKKREWSNWEYAHVSCPYYNAHAKTIVRTNAVVMRNNGKTVQLRHDWAVGQTVVAEANCNDCDEFNLDTGIEIALARLSQKLTQHTLDKKIEYMN